MLKTFAHYIGSDLIRIITCRASLLWFAIDMIVAMLYSIINDEDGLFITMVLHSSARYLYGICAWIMC